MQFLARGGRRRCRSGTARRHAYTVRGLALVLSLHSRLEGMDESTCTHLSRRLPKLRKGHDPCTTRRAHISPAVRYAFLEEGVGVTKPEHICKLLASRRVCLRWDSGLCFCLPLLRAYDVNRVLYSFLQLGLVLETSAFLLLCPEQTVRVARSWVHCSRLDLGT